MKLFVDEPLLAKGGTALMGLALGAVQVARGIACHRSRYAEPGSVFPGREKSLSRDEVRRPSHWLG